MTHIKMEDNQIWNVNFDHCRIENSSNPNDVLQCVNHDELVAILSNHCFKTMEEWVAGIPPQAFLDWQIAFKIESSRMIVKERRQ